MRRPYISSNIDISDDITSKNIFDDIGSVQITNFMTSYDRSALHNVALIENIPPQQGRLI